MSPRGLIIWTHIDSYEKLRFRGKEMIHTNSRKVVTGDRNK